MEAAPLSDCVEASLWKAWKGLYQQHLFIEINDLMIDENSLTKDPTWKGCDGKRTTNLFVAIKGFGKQAVVDRNQFPEVVVPLLS